MLSIKVWCLPKELQGTLENLTRKIIEEVRKAPGMQDENETTILVLFPSDQMMFDLGKEILVEAKFHQPSFNVGPTFDTYGIFAKSIGRNVISALYPKAEVVCSVESYCKRITGYWSSKDPHNFRVLTH